MSWRTSLADCGAEVLVHAAEFAAAAAAVESDLATRLRELVELGGDYDALIDGAAADACDDADRAGRRRR